MIDKYRKPYKPKNKEQKMIELCDVAKSILSFDVIEKYKRRFLDGIIWDVTEINGKQNIRYRSLSIFNENYTGKVIHEHVITKRIFNTKIIRTS